MFCYNVVGSAIHSGKENSVKARSRAMITGSITLCTALFQETPQLALS